MLDYDDEGYGRLRGYYTRPYLVRYSAAGYAYKDIMGLGSGHLNLEDRFSFRLTNLDDDVCTEDEYQQRDTIWLAGNDRAYVLFAEFLLNIGRSEGKHDIYSIEGTSEMDGILGLWSAEAEFVLPGSPYWNKNQLSVVTENQS